MIRNITRKFLQLVYWKRFWFYSFLLLLQVASVIFRSNIRNWWNQRDHRVALCSLFPLRYLAHINRAHLRKCCPSYFSVSYLSSFVFLSLIPQCSLFSWNIIVSSRYIPKKEQVFISCHGIVYLNPIVLATLPFFR